MIPLDDRGFTLGDGLFETVLARDGELVRVEAHLARLARSCHALGLADPNLREAEGLMRQAAAELGRDRGAIRLTLTAGSGGRGLDRPPSPSMRMVATASPSPKPTTPARLVIARSVRRNALSPASRLKTLSYLDNVLAREEARAAGADEAVLLNTSGQLACAAAANLFWISGATVFTPALDCGVLAGTLRAHLMAQATVREVAAGPDALADADAVFLTNALIGVRPVAELDGRSLAADHPLVERLAALTDA